MKRITPIRLQSGIKIGPGQPCFIVAEIGNNHQGDFSIACEMVEAAAKAGAQGVKFQKRDMDALFTRAGREAPYTGKNSFGPTYGEHRNALELSADEMVKLKEYTESFGLVFFASAWDHVSFQQILDLDVELLKVYSADLVNVPMLRKAGESRIPVIMSTGMSTLEDIDLAVSELRHYHNDIIILHCNSSYPCPNDQVGLPVMAQISKRYGQPVGYSGHEQGIGPSVAAAALGACVVERHFTLDKTMRGTDHQASLEPAEFKAMCDLIRETEQAMLIKEKMMFPKESDSAQKLRKSIFFSRDLPAGHVLLEKDLSIKCPGTGLSPVYWDNVVGAVLSKSVLCEEPVDLDMLASTQGELAREVLS